MKLHTPWTELQVVTLNRYQALGLMHPYTCPRHHFEDGETQLAASTDGWHCTNPQCDYTQQWAHSFTADPSYLDDLLRDVES